VSDRNDSELHRRLGAELFNRVWDLLSLERRTADDEAEMIHTAHASRYHWSRVEDAHRCEAMCREFAGQLEDFDLPAMHEALARAHLVAGNREEALHRLGLATELCAKITDPGDRDIIQSQIDSITSAAA